MREAFRQLFVSLIFRRESVLQARMERTIFHTKSPFCTLARIRKWFSTAPLLCACTNDLDFATSNECARPFTCTRNLYVKSLGRFFSSTFTQLLLFSRFTYFCSKLSYACQSESISLVIFHYQLYPLRFCLKTLFYVLLREIRFFSLFSFFPISFFFILLFAMFRFLLFICYCLSYTEYILCV